MILIILGTVLIFPSSGWTLTCPPVGTTAYDPDVNTRESPGEGIVYLNLNEVAMCNGTVYGWRYCSQEDDSNPPLQLVLAMYRPLRNGTYQMVPGSRYQLRLEENNFDSFTCGNITLEPSEHFAVQENDVVAFCEEIDTARVELYSSQSGRSVWYWNAGGCFETRISTTGVPSEERNRVFFLSAVIDPDETNVPSDQDPEKDPEDTNVTSDQDTGKGSSDDGIGKVVVIVVIVIVVVALAAVVAVVTAVFCYKRIRTRDRSVCINICKKYKEARDTNQPRKDGIDSETNTAYELPEPSNEATNTAYELPESSNEPTTLGSHAE